MRHFRFVVEDSVGAAFQKCLLDEMAKRGERITQDQLFSEWVEAGCPVAGNRSQPRADFLSPDPAALAQAETMSASPGPQHVDPTPRPAQPGDTHIGHKSIANQGFMGKEQHLVVSSSPVPDKEWVFILKSGLYYRPNFQGYTSYENEAGVYLRSDADAHIARCQGEEGLFKIKPVPISQLVAFGRFFTPTAP